MQEINLGARQQDGCTLREHLLRVKEITKKTPPELLDLIELPESLQHIWDWYLRLNETRPVGMGISPISYTEIQSFFDLMAISVEPWEVELIKVFDRISMNVMNEEQEKRLKQQQAKQKK